MKALRVFRTQALWKMNCRKESGCHTCERLTSCLCWRVETTDRRCLFVYAIGKQKWCSRCTLFMSSKKFLKTPAQLHKQHHVALAKSHVAISKTQRDAGRILWWITKAQNRMTVQREELWLPWIPPPSLHQRLHHEPLLWRTDLTYYLFTGITATTASVQTVPHRWNETKNYQKKTKNCRTIWVEKATNTLSFFSALTMK